MHVLMLQLYQYSSAYRLSSCAPAGYTGVSAWLLPPDALGYIGPYPSTGCSIRRGTPDPSFFDNQMQLAAPWRPHNRADSPKTAQGMAEAGRYFGLQPRMPHRLYGCPV